MDGGGFYLHSVVLEGTALRVKLHGESRLTVYMLQHVGTALRCGDRLVVSMQGTPQFPNPAPSVVSTFLLEKTERI